MMMPLLKPLFAIFVLCFLSVACVRQGPFIETYAPSERAGVDAETLTVMSFNIRYQNNHKDEPHWQERKDVVFRVFDESAADIICLQEVLVGQFREIAAHMQGHTICGIGRKDGWQRGEYVPILFNKQRFSPKRIGHFWLSENPEQAGSMAWGAHIPRMVTWVHLIDHASLRDVLVFNAHFDHHSALARQQSALLLAKRVTEICALGVQDPEQAQVPYMRIFVSA